MTSTSPSLTQATTTRRPRVYLVRRKTRKPAPVWPVQPSDLAELTELKAYLARVKATDVTRDLILAAFESVGEVSK